MKSGKTISLTILIFAAVLPLFLSAIFLGGRIAIRITMLRNLDEEHITTIHIPEKDFKWFEENREILVDGRMFDVKSIQLNDGMYEVTGLYDEMETELNAMLEDIHKDAKNNKDKTVNIFQVCLGLVSETPFTTNNLQQRLNPEKVNYVSYNNMLITKGFFHPFFTPPRG
jgi:hypothetical protein